MGRILCVWAQSWSKGISYNGKIGWDVPEDFKLFKNSLKLSSNGKKTAMICGRLTYESMGSFNLCKCIPIIVSKSAEPGVKPRTRQLKTIVDTFDEYYCKSLKDAIELASNMIDVDIIVIAGGSSIYSETVKFGLADEIWLTQFNRSDGPFETDNPVDSQPDAEDSMYKCTGITKCRVSGKEENKVCFSVYTYKKGSYSEVNPEKETQIPDVSDLLDPIPAIDENRPEVLCLPDVLHRGHEEFQYLDLIKKILTNGNNRLDRTKVGTRSLFGNIMRFNLKHGLFPLLTTKRVFWRGVVEELLWFIRGDTNAKNLSDRGVRIWDGNSTREFLDSRGLNHREEGDLGPIYGFQWRHYGAEYDTMYTDYNEKGIDQLKNVIETLKNNPTDRRMIVCAWNPAAMNEMALPPCHCLFQFYVRDGNKLSLMMYQRSADIGLGVPFNIASYSLLVIMVAQCVDMIPDEFVHVLADTHVYSNHENALRQQLMRSPRPFPLLEVNPEKKDINTFVMEDFKLVGYNPHKKLEMEMAV